MTKKQHDMQLTDLAALADTNVYKGIRKFTGVGKNRKLDFKTLEQELKTYCTNVSQREISIIYGKDVQLNDVTLEDECTITHNDLMIENPSAAHKLHSCDYFWTIGFQQVHVDSAKKKVFYLLQQIFLANPRSEVDVNGWQNVHLNMPKFIKDFGTVTAEEVDKTEQTFELGLVKKNGQEMFLDDNAVDMLNRFQRSQHDLRLI